MNDDNLKSQVDLFKSIFRGREDVFAVRWEKGSKSKHSYLQSSLILNTPN